MVEALHVRPFGQKFFAQFHESLLKIRDGVAVVWIANGHDAALTWVVAEKFHRADLERLEFAGRAEKPVFAKRLIAGKFKICAKPATQIFQRQFGKPFLDFAQAGVARDGRAKRLAVVGKTFLRFASQRDGKSEKFAQPFFNFFRRVKIKLRGRRSAILPELNFPDLRVEFAAQLMHARRALAVHDYAVLVENRVDAVVRQNAARCDLSLPDGQAVQRFDRENLNLAEMHPAFNTTSNYLPAIKISATTCIGKCLPPISATTVAIAKFAMNCKCVTPTANKSYWSCVLPENFGS